MPPESNDERALLHEYVRSGSVVQIATCSVTGEPWMAHCWYASDERLNLIFMSRASRKHSEHIMKNPRVSAGILAVPLEGLGQKVRGVILEGNAELVSERDVEAAYKIYKARWPQVAGMVTPEALRDPAGENRLWKVLPRTYVLFDEQNFPSNPRRELRSW